MKKLWLLMWAFCVLADAQIYNQLREDFFRNDASAGTATWGLVSLGTQGRVKQTPAGAADGTIGICVNGCGVDGVAEIVVSGVVHCRFDGATTVNDWVQISPSAANNCHDSGSSGTTPPSSGQIIGLVLSTNAGAGIYDVQLQLRGAGSSSGGGGGLGSGPCTALTASGSTFTIPNNAPTVNCFGMTVPGPVNVNFQVPSGNASGPILLRYLNTVPTANAVTYGGVTSTNLAQPDSQGGANSVTIVPVFYNTLTSAWEPAGLPTSFSCPLFTAGQIAATSGLGCPTAANANNISAPLTASSVSGPANAQVLTLPGMSGVALADQTSFNWRPTAANTTTNPTVQVGTTTCTLFKLSASGPIALAAGDYSSALIATARFNNTSGKCELQNPLNVSGGSGLTVSGAYMTDGTNFYCGDPLQICTKPGGVTWTNINFTTHGTLFTSDGAITILADATSAGNTIFAQSTPMAGTTTATFLVKGLSDNAIGFFGFGDAGPSGYEAQIFPTTSFPSIIIQTYNSSFAGAANQGTRAVVYNANNTWVQLSVSGGTCSYATSSTGAPGTFLVWFSHTCSITPTKWTWGVQAGPSNSGSSVVTASATLMSFKAQ